MSKSASREIKHDTSIITLNDNLKCYIHIFLLSNTYLKMSFFFDPSKTAIGLSLTLGSLVVVRLGPVIVRM